MSSLLFGIGLLVVLVGLYLWARRRAESIRLQAAQREQAAMAMMLGSSAPAAKPGKAAPPAAPVEEIDHAALIRQAHGQAAEQDPVNTDLPPLEYDQNRATTPRALTPAEEAAAGLDPIEDLISQIMVDDSGRRAAPARATPPPPPPPEPKRANAAARAAAREATPMLDSMAPTVPLRELVLAWYESRGYRQVPASPAVWPIELVLRHRDDPARAYAFVVQNDNVSVDRITALIEQAREIGMLRVAVIAEAGYERGAKEIAKRKNVRLIDRPTMDAELSDLQLETAAKIIAVARTRASQEASAA